MKLNTDLRQVAAAVKGRLVKGDPGTRFDGFVTDTRKLKVGDFFWALKGLAYDAHDYLPNTVSAGAAGWLVREDALPCQKDLPPAVIAVKDTLKALQDLAAWHRQRFDIPLVAITGSNGKSTTKEMIRSIFSDCGPTCSNAGNLNNQFGLPLSLLELTPEHKFGVFELGASHRGDIREIGEVARPTCGVITNIGPSHLQYFGDLETIFETKTELASCLAPGGTLVYNFDDQYLSRLNGRAMKKLTFGRDPEADIRILEGDKLRLEQDGEITRIDLPHAGGHNFLNAAAAAATALASGLGMAEIKRGLEHYTPPPMRLEELKVCGSTVILDAYNANPQSMASAVKEMLARPRPLYFMLGDMKELGEHSARYHTDLGAALAHTGAERVFLAGPEMRPAVEAYMNAGGRTAVYAETLDGWMEEARGLIRAGKGTFLIKASRSMKFERLLDGLR